MATNLRLDPTTEAALRREAEQTGRSQQAIIREALVRHLGLGVGAGEAREVDALVDAGTVRPPRTPLRTATRRLRLPAGVSSDSLLDRDDRL
jgi:hypothetical protein